MTLRNLFCTIHKVASSVISSDVARRSVFCTSLDFSGTTRTVAALKILFRIVLRLWVVGVGGRLVFVVHHRDLSYQEACALPI
jgi:pimeloyl-CoA synthetase